MTAGTWERGDPPHRRLNGESGQDAAASKHIARNLVAGAPRAGGRLPGRVPGSITSAPGEVRRAVRRDCSGACRAGRRHGLSCGAE
jgi:hypothetical protein